jgi:hypothetical protein
VGPVTDRSAVLAKLARAVAEADPTLTLSARLCRGSASILDAEGAAVTLATGEPERLTVYATDAIAARLAELEEVIGEGPGVDAFTRGESVLADLGAEEASSRWPMYTSAATEAVGRLRVLAVPMRPEQIAVGVLTLQQVPVAPGPGYQDTAQLLADAIAVTLLRDSDVVLHDAEDSWPTRATIHQSVGMVVAQLRVDPDDAEALLRAHAYALDTSLADIARHVVNRTLVFSYRDDRIRDENR